MHIEPTNIPKKSRIEQDPPSVIKGSSIVTLDRCTFPLVESETTVSVPDKSTTSGVVIAPSSKLLRKLGDLLGFTAPTRSLPPGTSFSDRMSHFQDASFQRLMNFASVATGMASALCFATSFVDFIFGNPAMSFKSGVVAATASFATVMMCLCARQAKRYRKMTIDRAWKKLEK